MDGPGIESRWGARFTAPVQASPEVHPDSYTMGTGSLPGVILLERGVILTTHPSYSTEVEGRVELYLCSPSKPSWSLLGWPLPLHFKYLTLILLTSRIWWAPNNASKWQMGFNSAFEGLNTVRYMGSRIANMMTLYFALSWNFYDSGLTMVFAGRNM